jgi:GH15 family glucan-1,4-alpha-glucosidase
MSSRPISDYALLGNCRSAALVSSDGSIDWWCAPRFDSAAVFSRILDERAGHFRISPTGSFSTQRRYLNRSLVLETTMTSATGTIRLTDALAIGPHETGHQIGLASPAVILRRICCDAGEVEVEIDLSPRPEYGLIAPLAERCDGGVVIYGGADVLLLSIDVPIATISNGTVRARFTLRAGQERYVALERSSTSDLRPRAWRRREILRRLEHTLRGWQTWSGLHQSYQGAYDAQVRHGGRVLQALTYAPTGSIVAAPTTSLAETPGGTRNWDYRYAWIRDASLTMNALWTAACPDEAHRYFGWLANSAAGDLRGRDLQIVFGVGGERDLSERELGHLQGWRDSRPVRVGNDAWRQRQIDVYGELVGAAFRFRDQLNRFDPSTRAFVIEAIERAVEVWPESDCGIWEVRDKPQHFVHSKLMCWQALEAGIALAAELGVTERVDRWTRSRDQISAAIRANGWSEKKGCYTQAFDSDELDASVLLMIVSGFLAPDDPRASATVRAIASELGENGLVRRYAKDGIEGEEGAFVICSFWLAEAQAIVGDIDGAQKTFEHTAGHANDVGLLAEEIDIATGELLGNFPQAFSHVGLINAATAIDNVIRR